MFILNWSASVYCITDYQHISKANKWQKSSPVNFSTFVRLLTSCVVVWGFFRDELVPLRGCEASQWELCTVHNASSHCCVQREAAACSRADTLCCFMFGIYRCGLLDLRGPNTDFSPQSAKMKAGKHI